MRDVMREWWGGRVGGGGMHARETDGRPGRRHAPESVMGS